MMTAKEIADLLEKRANTYAKPQPGNFLVYGEPEAKIDLEAARLLREKEASHERR